MLLSSLIDCTQWNAQLSLLCRLAFERISEKRFQLIIALIVSLMLNYNINYFVLIFLVIYLTFSIDVNVFLVSIIQSTLKASFKASFFNWLCFLSSILMSTYSYFVHSRWIKSTTSFLINSWKSLKIDKLDINLRQRNGEWFRLMIYYWATYELHR